MRPSIKIGRLTRNIAGKYEENEGESSNAINAHICNFLESPHSPSVVDTTIPIPEVR